MDASHEVSISRVLNPNFITPPAPRATSSQPRLLSPTLNPSFSQPPRISTRVFATLGLPTDNVPTVLYSHPWSSNSNLPSFAPPLILADVLSYLILFLIFQFFLNPLPLDIPGLILMNPGPPWDHLTIATRWATPPRIRGLNVLVMWTGIYFIFFVLKVQFSWGGLSFSFYTVWDYNYLYIF